MNPLKLYFSRNRSPVHVHFDALTGLDYNEITDGIYVGTNQCCTVGLSDVLKKENIHSDISLEQDRIDQPFGVETYTWIPIKDHSAPTRESLDFGIKTLETLVSQHKKVYVHCKNGHGRSSTLVCGYLMKTKGMTLDQAFAVVKEKRPGAHMQEPQIAFLRTLEKR